MTPEIIELLVWIKTNSHRESIFLTPNPTFTVNSVNLIDEIIRIFKLNKEQIIAFINHDPNR